MDGDSRPTQAEIRTMSAGSRATGSIFNLEDRFDSNNSLIFRPNIIFQHSYPSGSSFYDSTNETGQAHTENAHTSSSNTGFSVPNAEPAVPSPVRQEVPDHFAGHQRIGNCQQRYGYLQSVDSFYQPPTGPSSINLNQYYNDSLHSYQHLSQRYPIPSPYPNIPSCN